MTLRPRIISAPGDSKLGHYPAGGSLSYYDFFVHEFWRFVYVQKEVGEYAQTFIEFPPMQKGASFNMEAVKEQIAAAQKRFHSQ